MEKLAVMLNEELRYDKPDYITKPTDSNLKIAGAYKPELGMGIRSEKDHGSHCGAQIMQGLQNPEKH